MPRTVHMDPEGRVSSARSESDEQVREKLRQLAWLLDSSIRIPGTSLTIGVDALIGLFPVAGDLIGVALSSYIVTEASRLGAPKSVLLKMSANIALEGIVGIIPIAGDLFDAAFKANQRNVRLLSAWYDNPRRTTRSTRTFATALILGLLALLTATGAGVYALISALSGI